MIQQKLLKVLDNSTVRTFNILINLLDLKDEKVALLDKLLR